MATTTETHKILVLLPAPIFDPSDPNATENMLRFVTSHTVRVNTIHGHRFVPSERFRNSNLYVPAVGPNPSSRRSCCGAIPIRDVLRHGMWSGLQRAEVPLRYWAPYDPFADDSQRERGRDFEAGAPARRTIPLTEVQNYLLDVRANQSLRELRELQRIDYFFEEDGGDDGYDEADGYEAAMQAVEFGVPESSCPRPQRALGEIPAKVASECAICLVTIATGEAVSDTPCALAGCTGTFHPACIHTWRQKNDTCPCCRRPMSTSTSTPLRRPMSTNLPTSTPPLLRDSYALPPQLPLAYPPCPPLQLEISPPPV